MSTTTTVASVNDLRGAQTTGELHDMEVVVYVTGTYNSAARPSFSILTALQTFRGGCTAVVVPPNGVTILRDYNDGTNRYTAPDANVALTTVASGSTNDTVTFQIHSGAINGAASAEIGNGTALSQYPFVFNVRVVPTGMI